jgi:mono/diheme cytochrome c family protein
MSLVVNAQERQELRDEGKVVYQRRCVGCHGEKGDGNGPSAIFMDPKPRDFTKGIFKFRSTSGKDSLPSDSDLFITVTHGLWGTAMPSWAEISERERIAVIQYIKSFSDRWTKEAVPAPIDVPAEPPVTAASIANGKALFHGNAICHLCHGEEGKGDGQLAPTLVDEWGQPEHPANFTLPAGVGRGVKLGHDGVHIFKTIMTGVGGTPMPDFEASVAPANMSKGNACAMPQGALTTAGIWDIVHYVQSLRIQAHGRELVASGLQPADRADALSRMWESLSPAAEAGHLDQSVIHSEVAELGGGQPLRVAHSPMPDGGNKHL